VPSFCIFVLSVGDFTVKNGPMYSDEVPKAAMCLMEKTWLLDKLCSFFFPAVLGFRTQGFMLVRQAHLPLEPLHQSISFVQT
jgi:hypothetical protein